MTMHDTRDKLGKNKDGGGDGNLCFVEFTVNKVGRYIERREFEKIGEFLNSRMLCKRMNKLTGYEELKM